MYSLPTSVTFAAFTIASAASTDPMSPRVSTSPSASAAIRMGYRVRLHPDLRDRVEYNPETPTISLMGLPRLRHSFALPLVTAAALVASMSACRRKEAATPPVATPSLKLNFDKAPLGSPLDVTYRFVVANDPHFEQDYRVMVHVVDSDEELIFNFDHNPPTPTSQWKPGQTIEYTRTEFIPVFPYVGEASIQLGVYSTQSQRRLALTGEDAGQHAYKVARLQLQPQTENVYTVFKEGWHPAEQAEHNNTVEWQWTKKDAVLAFK